MTQVFVLGKDWRARVLLRAQLLEEGIETEAFETAAEASAALPGRFRLPRLIVADLTASEHPENETNALALWAERIPVWIIAGREVACGVEPGDRRFARILYRPVDVGELVKEIKKVVRGS